MDKKIADDITALNDIYELFLTNDSTDKYELIKILPKNLLTDAKKKYLDRLGDNITEPEFVKLLMKQTDGKDWINFIYLVKYYKLELDQNNFIIFTDEFQYGSVRKEPLYIWWLYNILNMHPMFKRYMSEQLLFSLQKKLEVDILPSKDNFKYDMYFDNTQIAIEVNEEHHSQKTQQYNDSIKTSLTKIHGIALLSLVTNNVVNVKEIKNSVYKDLNADTEDCLTNILNSIIYNDEIIVKNKLLSVIRIYFKRKLTNSLKANNREFNKMSDAKEIEKSMQTVIKDYCDAEILNRINRAILNSEYLGIFKSNFLDYILSSLLNNFKFRQDYITTIVAENLVELLNSDVEYIKYLQNNKNKYYLEDFEEKTNSYKNIKLILDQFSNDSGDFNTLLDLKKKSLSDPNNKVITFAEIISLLKVSESYIRTFRAFLNNICNIKRNITNEYVTISWKQLSKVLIAYKKKSELKLVLMAYYTELDTVYEKIVNRIKEHNQRINSNSEDYYKYMSRISIKTNKHEEINNLYKLINKLTDTNLYKLRDMKPVEMPAVFTTAMQYIQSDDLDKISLTDIKQRIEDIDNAFAIFDEPDVYAGSDSDPDEVDL
jgi:hypothetical protein